MVETLYHAEIYLPPCDPPHGYVKVLWSRHARKAACDDRYGCIPMPRILDLTDFNLVELAQVDRVDTKYVMRGPLDEQRDVVYVLRYDITSRGIRNYTVITVWVNLNTDNHRTLDRRKYATR